MVGAPVKIAVCLWLGSVWLLPEARVGPAAPVQERRQDPPPEGEVPERPEEKREEEPSGDGESLQDAERDDAATAALELALEALDEKQENLKDLQADFEQKQVSHLLAEPDVSRGKVLYRQGRLRMEWSEPRKIVLLVDGEGILQHFPDEKRAERTPAKTEKDIGSLFPGFGQSSEEMKKTYAIRLLPAEADDGEWCLELCPRRPRMKRLMKKITLWVDREAGVPRKMRIDDPNGKDYMETAFSGTLVNEDVPESALRLDLPEGTKVITVKGGLPF